MTKTVAITLILAILLGAVPAESDEVDTDYKAGRKHGEQEAKGESGWVVAGLLLGPIGVALAHIMKPGVYTGHLNDKSESYIEGYHDGFRFRTTQYNVNAALTGSLGFLFILFWLSLGQDK